jgi:cytidylate kinase
LVVAIDGPGGVGKSTVAKLLARRLGVCYVDTGATYRAVALAALRAGFEPVETPELVDFVAGLQIEIVPTETSGTRVELAGELVDDAALRTPEVAQASSRFAVLGCVRQRLSALQRAFATTHGGVLEGRDITTVVYPETPHRYYFDAAPGVRALRRWHELVAAGRSVDLAEVTREIEERDARDAGRQQAPLRRASGVQLIDTGSASAEAIAESIAAAVLAPV